MTTKQKPKTKPKRGQRRATPKPDILWIVGETDETNPDETKRMRHIRMTDATWELCDARAAKEGITRSELVRRLIHKQ